MLEEVGDAGLVGVLVRGAGVDDEPQLGPATGAIVLADVVRETVGEGADPDRRVVGDGSSLVEIDRPDHPQVAAVVGAGVLRDDVGLGRTGGRGHRAAR